MSRSCTLFRLACYLPPKEITNHPTFLSDPTIQKYEAEVAVRISHALSHGTYIGMEYGPCVEAGILGKPACRREYVPGHRPERHIC